ncbi:putative chitinase [Agrobacterium vitis]|nr:putative chitinase [Agrobacterium vitis]MBE1439209.1 putative chitinase [Agrobacterium vitis]
MNATQRQGLFNHLRLKLMGGRLTQAQVNGINAILASWAEHGQTEDHRQLSYVLATAFHETARTFQPVRETLATSDDQAIERLERALKAGQLPQVSTPYWRRDAAGQSWLGRGFVQLTHKRNYQAMAKALGVDLVADPAKAMALDVAADVLVVGMRDGLFSGRKLGDYFNDKDADWKNARRIVNGLDRADVVAGHAKVIMVALQA